uniref:ATP synthase complex subunit 8 n=1 Tax=Philotrypesis pilosa TaxID=358048 RepID=G8EEJ9_9HYME|nr:ATP synthase F0 subunit 8 [Philotrypesis pilosa]
MPQMSPLLWFFLFFNMMLVLIYTSIIIYFIIFVSELSFKNKSTKIKLNKFNNKW